MRLGRGVGGQLAVGAGAVELRGQLVDFGWCASTTRTRTTTAPSSANAAAEAKTRLLLRVGGGLGTCNITAIAGTDRRRRAFADYRRRPGVSWIIRLE